MPTIEQKLELLKQQEQKLLKALDAKRASKKFKCVCGSTHRISECEAVQSYWYESPHGCAGGDSWHSDSLYIVCPFSGVENRVLFDDTDLEYNVRSQYKNNTEAQFKDMYTKGFKAVNSRYDSKKPTRWANNFYFENNRKYFSLRVKAGKKG